MTPLRFDYPISVAVLYTAFEKETVDVMEQINAALTSRGHMVRIFSVNSTNWRSAIKVSGDVVVNLIEDDVTDWKLWAGVGKQLELMGRPQVGFSLRAIRNSLNKLYMKRKLLNHNLSTPEFRVIRKKSSIHQVRGLEYPLIVKPARQHSSFGIAQDSVVIDENELIERAKFLFKRFKGEVLIEEFIEGREINVTVIGNGRRLAVLPYAELNFRGEFSDMWHVYSYDAKWNPKSWEYYSVPIICPIVFPNKIEKEIDKLVKSAFRTMYCRDIVRFDLRLDEKLKPYIIDLNVNPDLNGGDEEGCWRAAKACGWSYADFIETLVAITYKRGYGRLPDRLRERNLLLTTR